MEGILKNIVESYEVSHPSGTGELGADAAGTFGFG